MNGRGRECASPSAAPHSSCFSDSTLESLICGLHARHEMLMMDGGQLWPAFLRTEAFL